MSFRTSSAFVVGLLLTCAAAVGAQLPVTSGAADAALEPPAPPDAPTVVLYDQYDNAGTNASNSQDFEAAFDNFDDQLADDFIVPGGVSWSVTGVDVDGVYFNGPGPTVSFNVFFYADSAGLPGAVVATRPLQPYAGAGGDAVITLTSPVVLTPGTYWVSVQARQDFNPSGQWGWTDRTVQSNNPGVWQNPGGGFGVCPTWTAKLICIPTASGPDQVFRLNGTSASLSTPLLLVTGETIGYAPNGFTVEAGNIVNFTYANSQAAPNQFAIFQTHEPWGETIVKTAITGAGYTHSTFTPAQLAGFAFSDYRVVVLNWDDHFLTDFQTSYNAAMVALQSYVGNGGVLWIQASFQGSTGDNFALPFGGQLNHDLQATNFIVDTAHPTMAGLSNPINGNFASHADASGLPALAHVVKRVVDGAGAPALYVIAPVIFSDNFNSGNYCRWSIATPVPCV